MSTRVFRKTQRKSEGLPRNQPMQNKRVNMKGRYIFNYELGNNISGDLRNLSSCVSPSDSPPASFFCFVFCPPLSSPGLLLCKRLKAHDPLCAEMCAFIQFVPLSNMFKLWNLGLCVSLYVSGHGAPDKRFGFVRIEPYWETKVHSHGPLRINFGEKKINKLHNFKERGVWFPFLNKLAETTGTVRGLFSASLSEREARKQF